MVKRLMARTEKGWRFQHVTSTGEITSRRMVRDQAKSQSGTGTCEKTMGRDTQCTRYQKERKRANRGKQGKKNQRLRQGTAWRAASAVAQDLASVMRKQWKCWPRILMHRERATQAELRKQGEGVQVAVVALQKIMRGKTP